MSLGRWNRSRAACQDMKLWRSSLSLWKVSFCPLCPTSTLPLSCHSTGNHGRLRQLPLGASMSLNAVRSIVWLRIQEECHRSELCSRNHSGGSWDYHLLDAWEVPRTTQGLYHRYCATLGLSQVPPLPFQVIIVWKIYLLQAKPCFQRQLLHLL